MTADSMIHILAYGSNMCLPRIRARAASAAPVAAGFVTHRRLAFHKRGADGSAKANAVFTARGGDRVWGVVFAIRRDEKPLLDACEPGYDGQPVTVITQTAALSASIYVARPEAIDAALRPHAWYHRLVIEGARQHRLPPEYIEYLQSFETIPDPDAARSRENLRLIGT